MAPVESLTRDYPHCCRAAGLELPFSKGAEQDCLMVPHDNVSGYSYQAVPHYPVLSCSASHHCAHISASLSTTSLFNLVGLVASGYMGIISGMLGSACAGVISGSLYLGVGLVMGQGSLSTISKEGTLKFRIYEAKLLNKSICQNYDYWVRTIEKTFSFFFFLR